VIIDGGKRCGRGSSIRSIRLTVGANEQCVVNRQRRGPQRRCRRQPPQCRAIRGMESPWFLRGPVRVASKSITPPLPNRWAMAMKSVWPCAASSWRMIKSLGSLPILPSQFFFASGVQMVEGAAGASFLRSPQSWCCCIGGLAALLWRRCARKRRRPSRAGDCGEYLRKGRWNCDTCRLLRMVAFAISQPKDVDVNEILFRPAKQAE
jgi:hypothetical protein